MLIRTSDSTVTDCLGAAKHLPLVCFQNSPNGCTNHLAHRASSLVIVCLTPVVGRQEIVSCGKQLTVCFNSALWAWTGSNYEWNYPVSGALWTHAIKKPSFWRYKC